MTRQVVLWRHGRTSWNVAGRVQGQSDIPLDEIGHEQARSAALRLAALRPDRIISSDLQRARDTAAYLGAATGVEVELDERFRELNFGAREGLTWRESWDQMPEGMQAWVDGDETKIPGSETHQQAGERFSAGLRAALPSVPKDGILVVVAHGAVLRTGICAFLGIPQAHWGTFGALNNCAWSVLEETPWRPDTQWRLTEWNAGTLPEPVMADEE
ncbi:histidine phosphatase family protein [Aeromicrobium wangtongii]|uniref:histidine phosphatase family protein n=1 Tax=Aeromicrobium wangtongii TaxID=2969247 RepID=UPI0020178A5E|nr:histidine phosphatase family protein [Aeromicrobium wangtongii]MCL3818209.1 histidine phosphatase family protein [Aeromicrobium wangtongii]